MGTQIYLDDEQRSSLAALARKRGVTASAVIREAIDGYIARQLTPHEKIAGLRTLGAKFAVAASVTDAAARVENLRSTDADRVESPV